MQSAIPSVKVPTAKSVLNIKPMSVSRSRTFVKMRRSKIRPIPVSAVWKVPDDLAQTRVSLHAGKSTPLF